MKNTKKIQEDDLLDKNVKFLPTKTLMSTLNISIEKVEELKKEDLLKPRVHKGEDYYSLNDFEKVKAFLKK